MIKEINYENIDYFIMAKTYGGWSIYQTGCYLVDGLFIDCGPINIADEFKNYFKKRKIAQLVNTHHHEDHSGNNYTLNKFFGIIPYVHQNAIEILRNPYKLYMYRKLAWDIQKPCNTISVGEKIVTDEYEFKVIYTPGHTNDHICLYEEKQGWIFTGDLYLGQRTKLLDSSENIYGIIDSLKKISELPAKFLFCAHKGKVEEPEKNIRLKIKYLEEMKDRIFELYNSGKNINEITKEILGSDFLWKVFTGGNFTKENYVKAFLKGSR